MAATAKHFPGLGSATTSQNTDIRPVTLNVSLSGLRSKDEAPYPAAIAAACARRTWPWISASPTIIESRPAVTQ